MKITWLLLTIALVQASASTSYSQTTKLTLDFKDVMLKEVFEEIENTSEFRFFYDSKKIDPSAQASVHAKDSDIKTILDQVLASSDITYEIIDRYIVLKKDNETSSAEIALASLQQDGKTVTGTIRDAGGQSIPGASIVVKGTTTGTISDMDGNFTLSGVPEDAILQFSFVGMNTVEVPAAGKTTFDVVLQEETLGLDEVIVVGYGVQKKINMTGAVSSIAGDELESRPVTQASQALAGLSSGITVSQNGGQPGRDGASINIRGLGTFSKAGNSPLVLVDGLASSLDDVDPNNIETISVLKDAASSAIYGTRAANGVILITTKQGKQGKMQINYDSYFGWQKATELPDFVESAEFAELKNEITPGSYSPSDIEHYRTGDDPDNYPNVPHTKNLLESGSGFQTRHHMSINGGTEKTFYLFSFGYLQQNGIVDQNKYEKYNFLLNLKSELTKGLDLRLMLKGNLDDDRAPRSAMGSLQSIILNSLRQTPITAGRKSDGTYGFQDDNAPEAWLDSESFDGRKSHNFAGAIDLSWQIYKDLSLEGKAGYTYFNSNNQSFISEISFNPAHINSLSKSNQNSSLLTLQSILRYSKTIQDHQVSALAGFSQEDYNFNNLSASRTSFPSNNLYELDAGSEASMLNSGSGNEWALRSFFGRFNYSYMDKYLLELNGRYDGTSRFPEDGRWGFFPSVSAGWKLSEESFIKDNYDWISELKLRASWGRLGNQNVGTYPYQNVINLGYSYPIGQAVQQGAAIGQLSNADITWETTTTTGAGIDFSALNGKFNMSLDVFKKTTSDILYSISVPDILGVEPSEVNAGETETKGFELMMNYKAKIGDLKISVSPNYMYAKNEVTNLASVDKDISKGLFVGHPLNSIYGYVADGLFADQQEADAANAAGFPYPAEPGLINYKDISGPNGVPDGVVDAEYDRKVIASTFPKHSFGMNLAFEFKGIDMSMLFQGVLGNDKIMGLYQAYAFYNNSQIQRWQADNRWTTENPNPNAKYPKLINISPNTPMIQPSTYWLRDASFLRLKNLQIGYTFPESIAQKLKMSKLRVYFSGDNLLSFNNYYQGWDPEMATEPLKAYGFHPITSTYVFGLSVKF